MVFYKTAHSLKSRIHLRSGGKHFSLFYVFYIGCNTIIDIVIDFKTAVFRVSINKKRSFKNRE